MTRYTVHHARGSLWARQQAANKAGCCCYVEQHANAHTDRSINYAMAIVAPNASQKSKDWARTYTARVASEFGIPDRGVLVGPARGSYNVRIAQCPSFLAEPGFISNPEFAGIVQTGEGIDALARCLVDSIVEHFDAGIIGLSVGHKYRGKPDPGAPVYQDPEHEDPEWDDEAEIADAIINSAAEMLEGMSYE